jgi:glycolate oxidase FAD binding subunit
LTKIGESGAPSTGPHPNEWADLQSGLHQSGLRQFSFVSMKMNLFEEQHPHSMRFSSAIDDVMHQHLEEPGDAGELAAILQNAKRAGTSVVPTGGGTKLSWGNPPKAGHHLLSTRRLNRLLEHAWGDMTATVEAGCVIADLQNALAQHGQRLALDPLWPEQATVGGILATNDSGALRTRFGSLRDLIIGVSIVLPDGTIAKSGGKVVKNVAGYDIAKLVTGSLGTLGVITQAIFRLHPVPKCTRTLRFFPRDMQQMMIAVNAIIDSELTPSAIQICAGTSSPASVDILLEGTRMSCDAQAQRMAQLVAPNALEDCASSAWNTRETLFAAAKENSRVSAICKIGLQRSELANFSDSMNSQSQTDGFSWKLVAQAIGIGLLRLEADSVEHLRNVIVALREKLNSTAGSLAILDCPPALKQGIDVWGNPGNSLALMKSVKAHFDPDGILNPGRFAGAI